MAKTTVVIPAAQYERTQDKSNMPPVIGVPQQHFGNASKSWTEMSPAEQNAASEKILLSVKTDAFAHGLPITYELDGFVCQEYSDGHIIKIKPIEHYLINE